MPNKKHSTIIVHNAQLFIKKYLIVFYVYTGISHSTLLFALHNAAIIT